MKYSLSELKEMQEEFTYYKGRMVPRLCESCCDELTPDAWDCYQSECWSCYCDRND